MQRRAFVGLISQSGLAAWFVARAPAIARGASVGARSAVVDGTANVRDFGARGDGRTDDTAAFARCVGSLQPSGGTVLVPKGDYLINPLQSIVLVSNLTLNLDSEAILRAIPVAEKNSAVVVGKGVANVSVLGGTIVGERDGHLGTGGEWGFGVALHGCSDALIEGVNVGDCWGDGIYVGAFSNRMSERVTVRKCVSRRNRRQGMSITGCVGAVIEDSDFSDTAGTAPQSGIDVEPDRDTFVQKVRITNCTALRNRGFGIVLSGANVDGVTLTNNRIAMNALAGLAISRAKNSSAEANVIEDNGAHGLKVTRGALNTTISGNTICRNGRFSPRRRDNVFIDGGAMNTLVESNTFTCGPISGDTSRFDVRINSPDCVGTQVIHNNLRRRQGNTGGVDDHGSRSIVDLSSAATP